MKDTEKVDLGEGRTLELSVNDKELRFSEYPEDTWVDIEIRDEETEEDSLYLRLSGPTARDVKLEWAWDTWDDPGDYPSGAGGGPLRSYRYAYVEDASLDFKPSRFDLEIVDIDGGSVSKDELFDLYEITEEEFTKISNAARELAKEYIEETMEDNLDWFEEWEPPEPDDYWED